MKTLKIIGFLFLIFNFNAGICQVDLFMDDDEDSNDEPQEVNQEPFMGKITSMLKQGEASPIGNWAGETIEIMTDSRFADAPQEYTAAFQVRTKILKINAYDAAMKKVALSCEERKNLIESYLLYLGTIYLDMYSMDFFNDKKEYTFNEQVNVLIGTYDASTKFSFDVFDRSQLTEDLPCLNDIKDSEVTDCDHPMDGKIENPQDIGKILEMHILHPENIAKITIQLNNLLESLPCNKP